MTGTQQPLNPTLRGDRYRLTHSASVTAILGTSTRPVSSRGSHFFNKDRWTLRIFVREMCKWASENPGCVPTQQTVEAWVETANAEDVPNPEIVIAHTPDRLPLYMALALTGGAYHEAFHTLYSCRRDLNVDEMCKIVLPRWAQVPNWAAIYTLIQEWSNIIEDIRIERNGRKDFPGVEEPLHDLQDFILEQEAAGLADVRAHVSGKGKDPNNVKRGAVSIISAAFRDRGLGYATAKQSDAWAGYVTEDESAVKFVCEGPLKPHLDASIALTKRDDTGCLRIALDALIELVKASKAQEDEQEGEKAEDGKPGDGKIKCPKCSAPGHKLIVRPKSDGKGGKVKGVGICTCTVCGHQEEVKVKAGTKDRAQQLKDASKPESGPKFEGFDSEDFEPEAGGGGGGSQGDEEGEEEGEGQGSSEGDAGEDGADGSEEADNSPPATQAPHGPGKGSSSGDLTQHQGNNFTDVAANAVEGANEGSGLLDNNSALSQSVTEEEEKDIGTVLPGEQPYRPYNPGLDIVQLVEPSAKGRDFDTIQARALLNEVRAETAFLRARFTMLFRALERTATVHGVPKGPKLSEQFLVDSVLSVRSQETPRRAYSQPGEKFDNTMAAAIVIDESSSMHGILRDAAQIMLALAEPLDRLRIPVMCSGFRDGRLRHDDGSGYTEAVTAGDEERYHRFDGKIHDVFKRFDERLDNVLWRFANTRATGSTPMADGIQFGLDGLNFRREAHRVLFVVTDGCPTEGHKVIPWQIRVAREAGIHTIGVGIGSGSEYVKDVFTDHIWAPDVHGLPMLLVAKLNELIDIKGQDRGRRMRTGSYVAGSLGRPKMKA